MIRGASVTVHHPAVESYDRLGNPVDTWTTETVSDVLIAPGATESLEASRPEGVQVAFSLHFPKAWTGSLEGCKVELPVPWGGTYRVIGSPQSYMDENTPTRWNRTVEVEVAHG